MLLNLNIKSNYVLVIGFIIANIILFSQEFYYLLLLPPLILLIYVFIKKPVYIVYFLAFATPLSIQLSEMGEGLSLSLPTEPLIILLFFGLLLKSIKAKAIDLRILKTTLAILLLTDLTWMAITSLSSTMPLISLKYLVSKSWYLAVFYFLLTPLFRKHKVVKTFMWSFIIAVVLLAMYTLYNHSAGGFSRSYAYTAMRPFLPDHGMYAAMISFAVPILFVFARYGNKLNYSSFTRLFALGLCAFIVLAVALSFTRASWLSLVISFGIYIALLLKIKFRYLLFIGLGALAYLSVNFDDIVTELSRNKSESDDNIEEHLQSVSNVSSDPSNLERLNRWSCAYRMFEDKPVLGFGPGTYTFQYGVYQLPHEMTIISSNTGSLGNVHSEYLRPLVEGGMPAFILFLSIVIVCCYMGFYQFKNLDGQGKYLSLAALMALVTYFSHAVLNNYSEFDKIAVPLYACMAVLTAQQLNLRNKKDGLEEIQKK
ncbi:MAG: O-antigen ligase family protein [Bacteroidia bacterium]